MKFYNIILKNSFSCALYLKSSGVFGDRERGWEYGTK